MEKYGTSDINNVDLIKQKRKQTCIEHFGVDNPLKSSIIL